MILILQSVLEPKHFYVLSFQEVSASFFQKHAGELAKIFWLFQAQPIPLPNNQVHQELTNTQKIFCQGHNKIQSSVPRSMPAMDKPIISVPSISEPCIGEPSIGEPSIGGPSIGEPFVGRPFIGGPLIDEPLIDGPFIGPRRAMITPWSTNAVEILKNVGLSSANRVEEFRLSANPSQHLDPMTQEIYPELNPQIFILQNKPAPIEAIADIAAYNQQAGLALSKDEIDYLQRYSQRIQRPLTDAELFGFAQANSEHCRHKVFQGQFIIDGQIQEHSLFDFIRQTSFKNPANLVSAYIDNVAFFHGPKIEQFAPDASRLFRSQKIQAVLSLKAETHNFPTTVCAFPGAATGTGGEIRDRMGGGRGSLPGVGTAAYLTSYPRLDGCPWEHALPSRHYLYQDPATILIQASNGASDYGNKFGQPLVAGSVTTFEHLGKPCSKYLEKHCQEHPNTHSAKPFGEHLGQGTFWGFDKVIMLAGGVGQANAEHAQKLTPQTGDKIVLLGGDNYRIGIGGGAVSSVNTGQMEKTLELNAVQRSNPEMEQRVYRVIRALAEDTEHNPILSIHDHGAGGHFNCLSEMLKDCGGKIFMEVLPVGDPTLSDLEIIGNESQERMGLVIPASAVERVMALADRERCPCYVIGECTGDGKLLFQRENGQHPINLDLDFLFSHTPPTKIKAESLPLDWPAVVIPKATLAEHLTKVLRLTKVASKEWLTHKVDRSVTGLVAQQQTVGPFQLPLADLAVKALDYTANYGLALSLGDRPIPGLVNPEAGARLSVGESLLNIIWAPLAKGLESVVLSANWMWPCNQPGENANLYRAVQALGELCVELGLAVPTGKDSLSMSQKYPDGTMVRAPGTVIVTAAGLCDSLSKIITPDCKNKTKSSIAYLPFQRLPKDPETFLGTSCLAQVYNQLGGEPEHVPDLKDPAYFKLCFAAVQQLIRDDLILAGHDVSDGGIITALCEMAFAGNCGLTIFFLSDFFPSEHLFFEGLGVLIQYNQEDEEKIKASLPSELEFYQIAQPDFEQLIIKTTDHALVAPMDDLRRIWQKTSFEMEKLQMTRSVAEEGFLSFGRPMKEYIFPKDFDPASYQRPKADAQPKAAIIREKGTNGDREMAYALSLAGFEVRDVTTTDLTSGRETLEDIHFIVFCGGFSNSDVLGSARGWAGIFRFQETARRTLEHFYQRPETLSLGICNGCQLMTHLHLLYPQLAEKDQPKMLPNLSGIFESRFLALEIKASPSIFLKGLEGSRLGIWVAHGEGRFSFSQSEEKYLIPITYADSAYPANPNGSQFQAAAISSPDGRHLAMMPHPERAIFPWQWAYYPFEAKKKHTITPWIRLFVNAREWVQSTQ